MHSHEPYVNQGVEPDDLEYVIRHMRELDKTEADCIGADVSGTARLLVGVATTVYTAYYKDLPTFIFGTVQILPGVEQLFGFGTNDTRRVMPAVTWFTDTYWLPEMFESGTRRIQVHIPSTHVASLKWLEDFGMLQECELRDYSINGVPMLQLAYTRREYESNVLFQQQEGSGSSSGRDTGPGEDQRGYADGSRGGTQETGVLQ